MKPTTLYFSNSELQIFSSICLTNDKTSKQKTFLSIYEHVQAEVYIIDIKESDISNEPNTPSRLKFPFDYMLK